MQPGQTKTVPLLDVLVPPLPLPVPLLPAPLVVPPLPVPCPPPLEDKLIPDEAKPPLDAPLDAPLEAPPSSPPGLKVDPPLLELHACSPVDAVTSRPASPSVR